MCRSMSDSSGGYQCRDRNHARVARQYRELRAAASHGVPVTTVRQADPDFVGARVADQIEILRSSMNPATVEVARHSPVDRVRTAVLSSPLTSREEAETALFSRDRAQVKAALLNPNLSKAALDRFAEGSPADRVKAVEAMERCGHLDLTDLVSDPDPRVRLVAARKTNRLDHREHLLTDRATKVRLAIVERGGPIPVRFATEPVPEVRLAAAKHASNADVLHELAKDADPEIAAAAQSNPNFDPYFEPAEAPKRGSTLSKTIAAKKARAKRSVADRVLDQPDPSLASVRKAYRVANETQKIALSKKPQADAMMVAEHLGSWTEGEQVEFARRVDADISTPEGAALMGAIVSTKNAAVLEAAFNNPLLSEDVREGLEEIWERAEGISRKPTAEDMLKNPRLRY